MGHHPTCSQQRHTPLSKPFRRGTGPGSGELQNQVHSASDGGLRPGSLLQNSQISPLDEITAHDGYHIGILAQLSPQGGQLPLMAPVEGVVFRDDARHGHSLFLLPAHTRPVQEFFRKNYEKTVV